MIVEPVAATASQPAPLSMREIETRVRGCARLPSLRSIESALRELLNADQRYTSQISEVIRRDPSLTARLLRLVNSVYYGLTSPVNSIEEAIFYLGVRQIRQLAMVTPVIEDFQKMVGQSRFRWREFWQHCIGTAMLTREVIGSLQSTTDEVDYVAGLVHDMGKIVMASSFPAHFNAIYGGETMPGNLIETERSLLGMDHGELGAMYLTNHNLPEVLIETARFHHDPAKATQHPQIVAAVHLANLLVRQAGIGASGDGSLIADNEWLQSPAWSILFPETDDTERLCAQAQLKRSLERLPLLLEGLV